MNDITCHICYEHIHMDKDAELCDDIFKLFHTLYKQDTEFRFF